MKSFEAPDECGYKMVNNVSEEIVGLGPQRHTSAAEPRICNDATVGAAAPPGPGTTTAF